MEDITYTHDGKKHAFKLHECIFQATVSNYNIKFLLANSQREVSRL